MPPSKFVQQGPAEAWTGQQCRIFDSDAIISWSMDDMQFQMDGNLRLYLVNGGSGTEHRKEVITPDRRA